MATDSLPLELQKWVAARRRFRLSHAHVQMARELGLNPAKLGKIANHRQEPWKAPLPDFIEHLYHKRFRRSRPAVVLTVEQAAAAFREKKAARREARRARREQEQRTAEPCGETTRPVETVATETGQLSLDLE